MSLLCNQGMNNQTLWSRERFHEVWMCGRDFHTAERAHIDSSGWLRREMVLHSKLISREWLLWPLSSDPHGGEREADWASPPHFHSFSNRFVSDRKGRWWHLIRSRVEQFFSFILPSFVDPFIGTGLNVRKPAGRGGERHKMGNDYRLRSNFHSLECETSGFTSLLPPIHMEVSEPAGNPNASKLQQKNVLLFYLLLSERTAPAQHQGRWRHLAKSCALLELYPLPLSPPSLSWPQPLGAIRPSRLSSSAVRAPTPLLFPFSFSFFLACLPKQTSAAENHSRPFDSLHPEFGGRTSTLNPSSIPLRKALKFKFSSSLLLCNYGRNYNF